MTLRDAHSARNTRSAVKAATLKIQHNFAALAFLVCTLLMLASVIRMWSHWFEISAIFGLKPLSSFRQSQALLLSFHGGSIRTMISSVRSCWKVQHPWQLVLSFACESVSV
jgi:hypothetical protein